MSELLLEAFRHNIWATRRLVESCRELSPDQLEATPPGTYGTVIQVLNHLVAIDAAYLPRARVQRPEWAGDDESLVGLELLLARIEEVEPLWEGYLADPLPADDKVLLDEGAYQTQASVPTVQALHHGNSHREQVCALLTALGVEPPDLQAWAWAEATGRARQLR